MKEKMICSLAGLLMIGTVIGCKKDGLIGVGAKDEVLREVTFQINLFDRSIRPLLTNPYYRGAQVGIYPELSIEGKGNVVPTVEMQYLYLWTFNGESVMPDIGVDTVDAGISVITHNGNNTNNYTSGYAYTPYPAGKAMNITGAKEIIFDMPVPNTENLGFLRFDMSGSDTGPKDFLLYYSLNNGIDFNLISDKNQFSSFTGKNTFEYDLSNILLDHNGSIIIKMIMQEGIRGEGDKPYSTSGTVRIDNFALTGIYSGAEEESLNLGEGTVHYHVFNKSDSTLATAGQLTIDSERSGPSIKLKLKDGGYFMSVLVNFSEEPLHFPWDPDVAKDYYAYQTFADQHAVSYGTLISDIQVSHDISMTLDLERYYSQISFEFTDSGDLSELNKIEVVSLQKVFFIPYGPAFTPSVDWVSGEDRLIYIPGPGDNLRFRFNQFLGKRAAPVDLTYKLMAYDSEGSLLNEVIVNASIHNNVQLLFTGSILGGTSSGESGFKINWNNEWGEPVNVGF